MNTISIILLIAGLASIAIAILGKFRPDIVYKGSSYKIKNEELSVPEKQRWGFIMFLLLGIMSFMLAGALSIPQWQVYRFEIAFTIIMVMAVVMMMLFWEMVLSKRYRASLVIVLLLSLSLLAVAAYFWYVAV